MQPTVTEIKEWVILAKRHEQGAPNIGAPFYGPNYGGYVMRLSGAGLYTEQEAKREASNCGPGELLPYHFADPELRAYLDHWQKVRSSEFDLFHRVRIAEGKLAAIRAMATRSVPHMLNLAAIDRIIDEKPKLQLTPQELADFDKTGRMPEQKKPAPLPTKEALAAALSKRYGGRAIEAEEILYVHDFTNEDDTDQIIHFQAWRDAKVDWYEVKVSSAGQIDYTTITQLPF